MYSDSFFNVGFDEFLEMRLTQESASTYVYIYDHKAEGSLTEAVGGGQKYFGVCHADELQFLFPMGSALYPTTIPSERDLLMREALIEMWTNFATYGWVFELH